MPGSKQSSSKNKKNNTHNKHAKQISNKKHKKKSSDNILSDGTTSEDFDKYNNDEAITEYDQVEPESRDESEDESESGNESGNESESEAEAESESESEAESNSEEESEEVDKKKSKKSHKEKNDKVTNTSGSKDALKKKIEIWIKYDDKIKELNLLSKEHKDSKKETEKEILVMIKKLGMEEAKLDVTDKRGDVIARVYRHTSVTKSAIKEDLLKDALMEIYQNEKKSDQIIKKIDSKRKLNERFYLKRTKGEGGKK